MAAKPTVKSINAAHGNLTAAQKARLNELLANPGLRTLVADRYLTPAQRANRKTAQAAKQPVVPGSTLTAGMLNTNANAASDLRYGEATRTAQAIAKDTPGWYDAYRRELAGHQANVAAAQQQATQDIAGFGAATRGLDQSAANQMQGSANQDAAARGAVAGNILPTASSAASSRQALLGSFGAQQAQVGAANNSYASNLTHVVAPGQQLAAQTGAASKVGELQKQSGAFKQTYKADAIADEFKNVLSAKALNLDVTQAQQDAAKDAADIEIKRGVDPVTGKPIVKPKSAGDRKTEADLAFFREHGYYPPTGPPKGAKKATPAQRAVSGHARQDIEYTVRQIKALQKHQVPVKVKDEKGKWVNKVDANGNVVMKAGNVTRDQIRTALLNGDGPLRSVSNEVINAAYKIMEDGYLSPAQVNELRRAFPGISIAALGYKTGPAGKGKVRLRTQQGAVAGAVQGAVPSGLSSAPPVPGLSP